VDCVPAVALALVQEKRCGDDDLVAGGRADDVVGDDVHGVAFDLRFTCLQEPRDRFPSVELLAAGGEGGVVGEEIQRLGRAAVVDGGQEVDQGRAACRECTGDVPGAGGGPSPGPRRLTRREGMGERCGAHVARKPA